MPLSSDKGVYCTVAKTVMNKSDEFKNIIPTVGNFHCAKVVLHLLGKYLKGSDIEDALMERNMFSTKVIVAAMNDTQYVRSIKG